MPLYDLQLRSLHVWFALSVVFLLYPTLKPGRTGPAAMIACLAWLAILAVSNLQVFVNWLGIQTYPGETPVFGLVLAALLIAAVNQVTFDIIFPDKKTFEAVKKSGAITKKSMADLFGIPVERISEFVEFDPANAIKFTIIRSRPNGSPGDWDVLGCQYYAPLMNLGVGSGHIQQFQRLGPKRAPQSILDS